MKIEVGKKYKTRNGETATIDEPTGYRTYCYKGSIGGRRASWTKEGIYDQRQNLHARDLIEEIPEACGVPKYQVGGELCISDKWYKIVDTEFRGPLIEVNGRRQVPEEEFIQDYRFCARKPKIGEDFWSNMPAWVNFVAMDCRGSWYGYSLKPFSEDGGTIWDQQVDDKCPCFVPEGYTPDFKGDWKDSLIERA